MRLAQTASRRAEPIRSSVNMLLRVLRSAAAAALAALFLAAPAGSFTAAAAPAVPPPFPTLPLHYSATVVLTLAHINSTSSFEEIYDGSLSGGAGILRTNGRFADADLAEVRTLHNLGKELQ